MLVSVKHNAHIVAKVVNPLGTVVTIPNDEQEPSEEQPDEVVIHENCDEALFRPVVGARPVVCLQPQEEPLPVPNNKNNNKRYQGLKFDEIVHDANDKPAGKKNRRSKKTEKKEPIEAEPKEMWSSIEKILPEPPEQIVLEEDVPKEMWSSLEHCKLDESTYVEMTSNVYDTDDVPALLDEELTPPDDNLKTDSGNNNSSETTESDDSAKNKLLVSVADAAEDNTAAMPALETQSIVKTSKKKAKKKRK